MFFFKLRPIFFPLLRCERFTIPVYFAEFFLERFCNGPYSESITWDIFSSIHRHDFGKTTGCFSSKSVGSSSFPFPIMITFDYLQIFEK